MVGQLLDEPRDGGVELVGWNDLGDPTRLRMTQDLVSLAAAG